MDKTTLHARAIHARTCTFTQRVHLTIALLTCGENLLRCGEVLFCNQEKLEGGGGGGGTLLEERGEKNAAGNARTHTIAVQAQQE